MHVTDALFQRRRYQAGLRKTFRDPVELRLGVAGIMQQIDRTSHFTRNDFQCEQIVIDRHLLGGNLCVE